MPLLTDSCARDFEDRHGGSKARGQGKARRVEQDKTTTAQLSRLALSHGQCIYPLKDLSSLLFLLFEKKRRKSSSVVAVVAVVAVVVALVVALGLPCPTQAATNKDRTYICRHVCIHA